MSSFPHLMLCAKQRRSIACGYQLHDPISKMSIASDSITSESNITHSSIISCPNTHAPLAPPLVLVHSSFLAGYNGPQLASLTFGEPNSLGRTRNWRSIRVF